MRLELSAGGDINSTIVVFCRCDNDNKVKRKRKLPLEIIRLRYIRRNILRSEIASSARKNGAKQVRRYF